MNADAISQPRTRKQTNYPPFEFKFEKNPPNPPAERGRRGTKYLFDLMQVRDCVTINRPYASVAKALWHYCRSPKGEGKLFRTRKHTDTSCRVWRIK